MSERSTATGHDLSVEAAQVVSILTDVGLRTPDTVGERLDSMELARLVYEVEHRFALRLDLTDEQLEQMSTVSGAAEVIRLARAEAGLDQAGTDGPRAVMDGSGAGADGTGKEAAAR
ncbi:MAG TPA: hypothetical protein VFB84_15885 [Micromonosporaceae bacterium]|nr:hypothetical protein [Micromonosporaceae bacterium]